MCKASPDPFPLLLVPSHFMHAEGVVVRQRRSRCAGPDRLESLCPLQMDADDLLKPLRQEAKRLSWGADPVAVESSGTDAAPPAAAQEGFVVHLPRFQLPASFHIPQVSWPSPFLPLSERSGNSADAVERPTAA